MNFSVVSSLCIARSARVAARSPSGPILARGSFGCQGPTDSWPGLARLGRARPGSRPWGSAQGARAWPDAAGAGLRRCSG